MNFFLTLPRAIFGYTKWTTALQPKKRYCFVMFAAYYLLSETFISDASNMARNNTSTSLLLKEISRFSYLAYARI